jgi:hypothetical protein
MIEDPFIGAPSPPCIAGLNRHAMMHLGRMSSKPETHHG